MQDGFEINEKSRAYQEGLYAGINLPAKKLKNPKCPYKERHLISPWLEGFYAGLLIREGGIR